MFVSSLHVHRWVFMHSCSVHVQLNIWDALIPTLVLVSAPLQGLLGYHKHVTRQWRCHHLELQNPPLDTLTLLYIITHVPLCVCVCVCVCVCLYVCPGKVSVLESVGMDVIEAELIPTVELINYWPKKARWLRLLQRWPASECARSIKVGTRHWLFFSRAEQALLGVADEDGGCRRKCYRIIWQLKEDIWRPYNKPVITTFHLQTLLFWRCEKFPFTRDWRCVQACVPHMARQLHKCMSRRYLRHYRIRSHNLLKYSNTTELDQAVQKINYLLSYIHMDINVHRHKIHKIKNSGPMSLSL
uniref:Mab-21-like 3 n=1 Tax=Myripristis murdjan TaxID=586833 RepID=A0A668AFZ1_9TELE